MAVLNDDNLKERNEFMPSFSFFIYKKKIFIQIDIYYLKVDETRIRKRRN
jgi:hypothetical protein